MCNFLEPINAKPADATRHPPEKSLTYGLHEQAVDWKYSSQWHPPDNMQNSDIYMKGLAYSGTSLLRSTIGW